MTSPNQPATDGAYVIGSNYGSDITEDSAKALMTGGAKTSFENAEEVHDTEVKAPITSQAGSITNHETRIVQLENGGVMTVYSGNDTWNNPGAGKIGVAVINGGNGGQDGAGGYSGLRLGGNHGGYQYKEFHCEDLTSTVAITVGSGGSAAEQGGGTSSFGSYLVGVSGVAGAIHTPRGATPSTSTPGAGGNTGATIGTAGVAGGNSALAAGGAGGNHDPSTNGGAGGSVSVASTTPCGGGGGGGGGSTTGAGSAAGNGGAGGAPGGGGGAGGIPGAGGAGGFHGAGGNGRVYVIQF